VGASQITASEPLSLHRWISRTRPSNSAAAHAIHVPGGSRMFLFVVQGTFCSNLSSGRRDVILGHLLQDHLQINQLHDDPCTAFTSLSWLSKC
jgi:hypothetical protein